MKASASNVNVPTKSGGYRHSKDKTRVLLRRAALASRQKPSSRVTAGMISAQGKMTPVNPTKVEGSK